MKIDKAIEQLCDVLSGLSEDKRIDAINLAREAIHKISPFKAEPVDFIR